jgi:hypothetical protein
VSWLRPTTVVALFYGVVLMLLLATHSWDPLFFATLGPEWARHDPTGSKRADGSTFYALARDPIESARRHGAYRLSHVLYPLLARLLALGQPELIAWTLVLVNWAAIVLGTELMHRLLARHGAPSWTALAYGAWGGLGLALLHDTAEPTAYLAALLGIWCLDRGRLVLASGAFLASLLGREILVFLVGPYLLAAGRSRRGARRWLPAIVVLVLWLTWLAATNRWVGRSQPPSGAFHLPFLGYGATRSVDLPFTLVQIVVPAVLVTAYAARRLAKDPRRPALWAALANGLLVLMLGPRVTELLWHSGRVSTGLVAASLLALPLGRGSEPLGRVLALVYMTSVSWTIAVTVRYLMWDQISLR